MNRIWLKSTTGYPIDVIREAVTFARGTKEHGPVVVVVKNSRLPVHGFACRTTSGGRDGKTSKLVVLRIGNPESFPCKGYRHVNLKTGPVHDFADWIEALVYAASHELQHCQQFELGSPHSELQAERDGVSAVKRFREARSTLPAITAYDAANPTLVGAGREIARQNMAQFMMMTGGAMAIYAMYAPWPDRMQDNVNRNYRNTYLSELREDLPLGRRIRR